MWTLGQVKVGLKFEADDFPSGNEVRRAENTTTCNLPRDITEIIHDKQ